jgi:hypothetical protein
MLVALAAATNVLPLRQIVEQRQEVGSAEAELAALLGENEALESRVESLSTPTEIERLAREQLGYVRPGEKAFVVVESEKDPVVYPEDLEAQTSEDPAVGILERIWAFVTGRDLVDG